MQDVVAFANTYARWSTSLRYAAQFARLQDGSLTGLYVAEPFEPLPAATMPPVVSETYSISADIVREARAVEGSFREWAQGFGLKRYQWLVAEGYLLPVLASVGNWHDVLVLESGKASPWDSVGVLGQVLLTCGLPCIVVPQTHARDASCDRVAVAWNGSAEALRTVHAALPILRRAKEVVLIRGNPRPVMSSIEWKPPLTIESYLHWHEVRFSEKTLRAESGEAGSALLETARAVNAELLVMGAYGRTRFSEWVLGGATRHVLEHAHLPVFLRH